MLKLESIAHHRNGVAGEPFYVVTFKADGRNMVATVFYHPDKELPFNPRVAVLDRDLLAAGDIEFGSNSWRGDRYSDWLYKVIDRHVENLSENQSRNVSESDTLSA